MPKGLVDRSTMEGLAEQTRRLSGTTVKLTPKDAVAILEGLTLSVADDTQTYILVAEDGTEIPAVLVSSETVFDATANDIREGKLAVTDSGVTTGTKVIPSYHTSEGTKVIPNGSDVKIILDGGRCQYTKIMALVCSFNKTVSDSVAAQIVAIDDNVYAVNSVESLASIFVNPDEDAINLGITNNSGAPYILRYMTYKEEE